MVNTSQNFYMTMSMLMMDSRAAQRHAKLQISSKGVLQCAPRQGSGFTNLQQMTGKSFSKCIKSDLFRYKIVLRERLPTRRGISSAFSSIYDPLGLLAPFTLLGKQILQMLCQSGYDWDTEVSTEILNKWLEWKKDAHNLMISR